MQKRTRAQRLPPADRHQQLLDAAIRAFAQRGLSRTGHADVAKLAQVSAATVFSYFRTRARLVESVLTAVAHYYEAMADRFHQPQRDAARALLEHAVAFATSVESDPDHARVVLEWSTAIRDDSWPLFLRFQEGVLRRCIETIRRGQAEGSIDSEIDAETGALMIIGSSWMVIQMRFTHWPAERVHRFVLGQLRGAIGAAALAKALTAES
ncbi:TetR/AcrR family transcriptional regulator [bacterium]|nr:TetR/AcrR family transcriptional regulator [bacterium]